MPRKTTRMKNLSSASQNLSRERERTLLLQPAASFFLESHPQLAASSRVCGWAPRDYTCSGGSGLRNHVCFATSRKLSNIRRGHPLFNCLKVYLHISRPYWSFLTGRSRNSFKICKSHLFVHWRCKATPASILSHARLHVTIDLWTKIVISGQTEMSYVTKPWSRTLAIVGFVCHTQIQLQPLSMNHVGHQSSREKGHRGAWIWGH